MSGTSAAHLDQIQKLFEREVPLDLLSALQSALGPAANDEIPITDSALFLDSCIFIKLVTNKYRDDVLDFLDTRHGNLLAISGQSVQEFWNNQLAGIHTSASAIQKRFDELEKEVGKLDTSFGDYATQFRELLEHFRSEYGYIYDEATARNTAALVDLLQRRAVLSQAPRLRFQQIAVHRKKTKTPPGFKDEGDGDFFIWTDFLLALLAKGPENFRRAVMITDDKKVDWVRAGKAHPVLAAEVAALTGRPFEIWSLDRLVSEVRAYVGQ